MAYSQFCQTSRLEKKLNSSLQSEQAGQSLVLLAFGSLSSVFLYSVGLLKQLSPLTLSLPLTLPNARRFFSSKGDPLGVKGLNNYLP